MNPPGTGLGKNAEKARQMSGDAETSRRGAGGGRKNRNQNERGSGG